MPARFTTDDGDAYTADDGEFVLFSEYEAVLSALSSAESRVRELDGQLDELRSAVRRYLDDVSTDDGAVYEDVVRLRKLTESSREGDETL